MVTRNRKFPTPHGYSRNYVKRDTRQLLTEEVYESSNRRAGLAASDQPPRYSRVAFELEPSVRPRTGLDLTAVTLGRASRERPADVDAWWVRLSLSAFRWISWR